MKRLLPFLLVLVCMLSLFGCEKGQAWFNATVLEVNDGFVQVKCTDAFNSGIPADAEFPVSTDAAAANGVAEMAAGDQIRVVFNGKIIERNPIQLGTVFAIYRLDESGEAVPND